MISSGMHLNKSSSLFFCIKLVWATIIFYAWLSYHVMEVGQKPTDYVEQLPHPAFRPPSPLHGEGNSGNIIEQYIDEAINDIKNENGNADQGHFAASIINDETYKNKFDTICLSDTQLCDKLNFVGNYTFKEKFIYLSSIFKDVHFVQKNILVGNDLVDTLTSIVVDNSVGNRRGYATWDAIILNLWSVQSKKEFLELVAHELWHIVDLWSLQWLLDHKHGAFTEFGKKVFSTDDLSLDYYALSWKSEKIRKSTMSKKDFCSGYGMSDPFEDFAECFNLYLYHNTLFKTIAKGNGNLKKKYNFIATLLDWKYINDNSDDLIYLKKDINERPWDTTRIAK